MGFVNVGPLELLVIGVIALLVLGPKRLPDAARSVGRGVRELKEALQSEDEPEDEDDYQNEADSMASSSSSSGRV